MMICCHSCTTNSTHDIHSNITLCVQRSTHNKTSNCKEHIHCLLYTNRRTISAGKKGTCNIWYTDVYKYSSGYDTIHAVPWRKAVNSCHLRRWTNWGQGYLFLAAAAKDYGMTWMTNYNKSAGRGWWVSRWISQSRHHTMPDGHVWWLEFRRLVPTLCLVLSALSSC